MKKKKENKKPQIIKKTNPVAAKFTSTESWKYYAALAVILLISFIVYLPVFHNGFAWDDAGYLQNNSLILSINPKAFFSQYFLGNYHPLTILVFAIEYHFFGLNGIGYHAINLVFHLLNVILVFYAISLLCNKIEIALIVALLFGIHPMHVESVAWISELKDLLFTFFFLASFIFYMKFLKGLRRIFYILALVMFLFSLFSKAMAVSLPVVLLLTDYFKGRKITGRILFEKVPFFLLAFIFGVVAVYAQKSQGAVDIVTYPFPQRIVFACYGFITYLYKLILPLNLSAFYPYPLKTNAGIPIYYYIYVLVFLGLSAYVIYSLRFSKKIIFGIGFFAVTVFLVLQLLPVGGAIMADRYSYIPSIGIFYLSGEGLILLWSKKLKLVAIIFLCVFTVFFSIKTYSRSSVWKNDLTLWNDVISQYPSLAMGYYNRGRFYLITKDYDKAMSDFNKAIVLNTNSSEAYFGRGVIFLNEKKFDKALADLNKAIELNANSSEAYHTRGIALMNMNDYIHAENDINKVIELNPNNIEAYYNRGIIFLYEKKYDQALTDFNKAIELNPNYSEAYHNRGMVFKNKNDIVKAIEDINKAIELNTKFSQAILDRGIIFMNDKKYEQAKDDFNRCLELNINDANAYNYRGIVFMNEKNDKEAINNFNKAIELKHDYYEAYFNRGTIYMNEQRNNDARNDFNKAIELKPDNFEAYYNRGMILFYENKYDDAINDFSKTIALQVDYANAYYARGWAKYYKGNKNEACQDLKQAAYLHYQIPVNVMQLICH